MIFVPERNHIVSVSWDRTIRVWRSFRKYSNKVAVRSKSELDNETKFENWVFDQMKVAMKQENSFVYEDYATFINRDQRAYK